MAGNKHKQKSKGNQPTPSKFSILSDANRSPIDGVDSQRQGKESEQPLVRLTRWVAIWTAVLALSAISTGIISYFQWRELHNTEDTLRNALMVIRESSERQLRAYLGVTSVSFSEVGVTLVTENSGQTPAQQVKLFSSFQAVATGSELSVDFDYPDKPSCAPTIKSAVTMFPRTPLATGNILHCSEDKLAMIRAAKGELNLFLYGRVEYKDIFEKQRCTEFCFQLSPNGGHPMCASHNRITCSDKG